MFASGGQELTYELQNQRCGEGSGRHAGVVCETCVLIDVL